MSTSKFAQVGLYVERLSEPNLSTIWLLGQPVEHSLSPLIQNFALQAMGRSAVYLSAEVTPELLSQAVSGLSALRALGCNLTVPHKQAGFALCHRVSPRAQVVKAVNSLKFVGEGEIEGENTDGLGWVRGLEAQFQIAWGSVRVLVIGAGGAARGVVGVLGELGCTHCTVLNRTPERAENLVEELQVCFPGHADLQVGSLEQFSKFVAGVDLVVQTTSVGLDGRASPVPLPEVWPGHVILSELIYHRVTPLASSVSALGGAVQDGLPMLCYQAAEALAWWFDLEATKIPAAEMLALARRKISGPSPG